MAGSGQKELCEAIARTASDKEGSRSLTIMKDLLGIGKVTEAEDYQYGDQHELYPGGPFGYGDLRLLWVWWTICC